MAASLKVSELTALSSVAAADLLLIADASATASKKVTLTNLEGSMSLANLGTRAISDLSNVASTSPSSGQVLAYNGSAWAPANNTTKADLDVDHLITLSGVSAAADDLGTFSGSTITDSSTIKTALQELETAVEGNVGGATTITVVSSATNAVHYLTFVDSNNASGTAESLFTDAGVYYNPYTNQFTANGVNTGVLSLNSVDVTSTAAELNILDGVTATASELNILDGVTATASELNILDGVTATAAELNLVDGTTAGTVVASKAVAVDANKDVTGFRNITATGELDAATLDISGDADIDGTTNLDAVDIDGNVQLDGTLTVGSSGGGGTDYSTATANTTSSTFDGTYTKHTGFTLDTASPSGSSALFDADSTYAYYVMSNDNAKMLIFSKATFSGEWVFVHKSGADFRSSQLSDNDALGSTTEVATDMFYSGEDTVDGVDHPTADGGGVWEYGTQGSSYDVTFYGETSGATVTWDASVDDLIVAGAGRVVVPEGNLVLGSTAITSTATELNLLDGITAVADEDNMASNSATSLVTQQSVKAYVDANETHIDNIMTLLGETKDDTNLGTFTGSTISDNGTVRAAIQELETAVDSALGGGATAATVATVTRATDATHYLTFVQDDNGSSTQETIHTDAGVVYNPSSNLLTVGALTISGDLTVQGTTTNISSTTITVDDKNIELGSVASPSDTTADGGGITLKGATDKTINWINSTGMWTSSEDFNLVSGKDYNINGTAVLNATTLGSAVVNSSLTSVGTLSALTVSGDITANGNIAGDGSTNISSMNQVTASTFVGALTGNVTGDVTGDVTGNADTATKVKTISGSDNASHYVTFVADNNGSATAETVFTDAGMLYNPNANTLIVSKLNVSTTSGVTIDSVNLTSTATELNILDGATLSTSELNILDGVTSSTAELNILDGVTATAAELNILDGVTSTAAELNILDGVTSTAAELNILDGVTSTTAELNILDGVTATATELNILDGVTASTAELNFVKDVTSSIQTQLDAKVTATSAQADLHVDHLITLSGVAQASDDLGSFSGSIIADNETIKGALQDLEDQAGNITLTNIDIDGATSGTIATTSLFVIDEGANGTNKKATGAALATFVAAQKSVKDLKANSTSADSEPASYYFLVVNAADGTVSAINKEFVETEGSP